MLEEIKKKDPKLYYEIVKLLNNMKNGGGSIQWILNIYGTDDKSLQNLSEALRHINIAIDIMQGTMYPKDQA